jgi:hypothetical protein
MDNKGSIFLGACVIIAACILAFAPRSAGPPNEVGRYQFGRSNGVNVFVLDTKTGRVWQRFVDPSSGSPDWFENKVPWSESPSK